MSKQKFPQIEFRLPRGRLIRGSTTSKTTTNHKNEPLPENKHHFWLAIAVEKNAPGVADIVNGIVAHAWQSYQNVAGSQGVLQQIGMLFNAPSFAWKLDDGDTDPKWSQREGARGCYIFQMSTTFNLNLFDASNAQVDPKIFQLGDFVDAYIGVAINGEVGATAGIFINPLGVRWLGEGPRITAGRDAASMFGAPVGAPYSGHTPPPMSQQVMGQQQQAAPPQLPGQAGQAPGQYTPPPAPPPAGPTLEPAEMVAARHNVPHHSGFRFNPQAWAYEPDTMMQPATPSAPAPTHAGGYGAAPNGHYAHGGAPQMHQTGYPSPNGSPAGGMGAPAGAPSTGAPSVGHGGYQGQTAYPSNQYGPGNPPPVQPHTGFAGGPPRV